jgi:hypothetical protein
MENNQKEMKVLDLLLAIEHLSVTDKECHTEKVICE